MHYMGSKARHAAEIIAITTSNRRSDQIYVEPFVGGGNIINKVPQGAGRIANDKNDCVVALLDSLGNHDWQPPATLTHAEWKEVMKWKTSTLDREAKAWFALCALGVTFGSQWCGAWIKDPERYRQAREGALRDVPGLKGIEFHSGSYDVLPIPVGALVYCDPPYVGTTDYAGSKKTIKVDESLASNNWKAAPFWRWCDNLIDNHGCTVFVSEYKGPAPGDVYGAVYTPELKEQLRVAREACRALQADEKSSTADITAAMVRISELEVEGSAAGRALAARWTILWEKEVVSDFSATRGEDNSGKKETEKLFGRAP